MRKRFMNFRVHYSYRMKNTNKNLKDNKLKKSLSKDLKKNKLYKKIKLLI